MPLAHAEGFVRAATKPPRRPTAHRKPYVGPACRDCHHETLIVPCIRPECCRWVTLCGCPDLRDRYVETDGRCEWCRVQ